jgi:hypothetical protein
MGTAIDALAGVRLERAPGGDRIDERAEDVSGYASICRGSVDIDSRVSISAVFGDPTRTIASVEARQHQREEERPLRRPTS